MRYAFFAFLLMLSLLLHPAVPHTQEAASLEFGSITVWLGMSRAEVLKACAAAGYQTMDDKEHQITYIFTNKSKVNFRAFSVAFKAERVTFASRSWYSGAKDGFEAVLGALAILDGQHCSVTHEPVNKPEVKADRVLVSCGVRSVLVLKGTAGSDQIADVIERIGDE